MHTVTALTVLQPCPKSAGPKQDQTLGTVFAVSHRAKLSLTSALSDVGWRCALLHSDDPFLSTGPGEVVRDCQGLRAVSSELLQVLAM